MIEKASYIFDILSIGAGINVHNLHLNPEDEVANRPTGTINLFDGGIQRPSALLGALRLHQKVFRVCLPDALDGDAQLIRFDMLLKVLQNGGVAQFLCRLKEQYFWASTSWFFQFSSYPPAFLLPSHPGSQSAL